MGHDMGAARVKMATDGRIDGGRNVTGKVDFFYPCLRVNLGHGG